MTGETAVVLFANSPLGRTIVTELVLVGATVIAVDRDPAVVELGPLSRGLVTAIHAPDDEGLTLFSLAVTTIVICRPPAGWSPLASIGLLAQTVVVVVVADDDGDRLVIEDLARRGLRINCVVSPPDLERPDDVARCVAFLTSPAAALVAGVVLPMDDRRHLLRPHVQGPVHGRTSVHAA